MNTTTAPLPPAVLEAPHQMVDGIYVYHRADYNTWFEDAYSSTAEPWDYSLRGGEKFRHRYSAQKIKQYNPAPGCLLEMASSKGLMTVRLMQFCKSIYASDISFTAMKGCKQLCDAAPAAATCHIEYFVASTPGLPFAANSFDVVTLCDGLIGWWFSEDGKKAALEDTWRILKPGGIALLTDFIMPQNNLQQFEDYLTLINDSPLELVEVSYLYDQPWYKMESLLKKIGKGKSWSRRLLASERIARLLHTFGKLLGRKRSSHIVIVVRKGE